MSSAEGGLNICLTFYFKENRIQAHELAVTLVMCDSSLHPDATDTHEELHVHLNRASCRDLRAANISAGPGRC